MILATRNAEHLAKKVAKKSKSKLLSYKCDHYPNGELSYRLLFQKKPLSVTLIGNITADPESLFELLALAQAAKDSKIQLKKVIIPYLAYSRQDKISQKGEAMLSSMICSVLHTIKTRQFVFVDLHSEHVRKLLPKHREIKSLPFLAKQLKQPFDIVVAPDKGATERAKSIAKGKKVIIMPKMRLGARRIKREDHLYKVDGKNILIIDDMIDSGITLLTAAETLKKQGAKSITALATHGVFSVSPQNILRNKSLGKLYISDSLQSVGGYKNRLSITDLLI